MSAFDIIRQLEKDRHQLAHYQELVDELQQRIRTAERELAHAKPVITDETESDSHMSFREAMEFITGTVFCPVVRITDGLVIECTCEDGEFSSYSTGYVRDPTAWAQRLDRLRRPRYRPRSVSQTASRTGRKKRYTSRAKRCGKQKQKNAPPSV